MEFYLGKYGLIFYSKSNTYDLTPCISMVLTKEYKELSFSWIKWGVLINHTEAK